MKAIRNALLIFFTIFLFRGLLADVNYSTKIEKRNLPIDLSFTLKGDWNSFPANNPQDTRQIRVFLKREGHMTNCVLLSICEIPKEMLQDLEKEFKTKAFAMDLASVDNPSPKLTSHKVLNDGTIEFTNTIAASNMLGYSISRCIRENNAFIILKYSYAAPTKSMIKIFESGNSIDELFMEKIKIFHNICSTIKIRN